MVFMIRAWLVFILVEYLGPWWFSYLLDVQALDVFILVEHPKLWWFSWLLLWQLHPADCYLLPFCHDTSRLHCTLYKKGFLRFRATPKTKNSAPPSSLFSVAWEVLPPKLRCGYFEATNVNSRPPQLLHQKPTFPHFLVWHFILMRQREKVNSNLTSLLSHRAT